jgi:CO/xanthine dehydrogenase Mo-binding subunit
MTNYVGQSLPRYGGIGQVTGRTEFVDDVVLPGMVYVKLLRSPVHKGKLRKLDLSAVEATPGVLGTLTAADIPGANVYGFSGDQPVFNTDAIRYRGEPLAAVVAVDEDTCYEALQRARVDIEEQEPVFDLVEAMKPGAPIVRAGTTDNLLEFAPGRKTSIIQLGDVDEGFAEADFIVEDRFVHGVQDHSPIEPHVSVAHMDAADNLVIHTVSQMPYFHLRYLQPIFNLPLSRFRFLSGTIGGAFGAKNEIHADHFAGLAALKFRRPVKYRWTRREYLPFSSKRGAWVLEYKSGIKKDGRVVARSIKQIHDTGAYGGLSVYAVEKNGMFGAGGYSIPNIRVESQIVFTNRPLSSSMRGFGLLNGQTSVEIHMNRIAEALGMDPWELRFLNCWRDGDVGASQYVVQGAGGLEAMKKLAEVAGVQLPAHLMAMSSRGR